MSMYARAARNGKSKREHSSAAAPRPTTTVNDARASRYIPAARTTNDANVAPTMIRSASSPKSESTAPNAIASGCSGGARGGCGGGRGVGAEPRQPPGGAPAPPQGGVEVVLLGERGGEKKAPRGE